jgi:hypothetical protein
MMILLALGTFGPAVGTANNSLDGKFQCSQLQSTALAAPARPRRIIIPRMREGHWTVGY